MTCQLCNGERWVCENHPDKAWEVECGCGAGMPCECNTSDPPEFPPGSTELWRLGKRGLTIPRTEH